MSRAFPATTSLTHAHLTEDDKEKAKKILGMSTVPFYVVVGQVKARKR